MLNLDHGQWEAVAERLGRPAGELLDAKDKAILIPNHHAWCREIAKRMGGATRPTKVWEAVADVWVRDIIGDARAATWCQPIVEALGTASNTLRAAEGTYS